MLPREALRDVELNHLDGQRYRIVFTSWRDGEDEHGYYRVSTGHTVWPMTYVTRAAASALIAEAYADDVESTVTIERTEPESFTRADLQRVLRRAVRRAVQAERRAA